MVSAPILLKTAEQFAANKGAIDSLRPVPKKVGDSAFLGSMLIAVYEERTSVD
jgi:hypothetical protein